MISGTAPAADRHTLDFTSPNAASPDLRPLLGVIAGPDPNTAGSATQVNLTEQYQDAGLLSVRNNDYFDDRLDMEQIFNCGGSSYPSWEGCDPNDDRFYNWTASDAQFQSWLNGGFEPFLRLGGETNCGCRQHDFAGPQNSTQEDNWIVAAKKVFERYNNWQGRAGVLRYLDIWTEWPNTTFYDGDLSRFPVFWTKAYSALKAAYPNLKIGGPGLLSGSANQPTRDFLTYLYQNGAKPDWIGFHVFSSSPHDSWDEATAYRQLLDGTGSDAAVSWAGTGFFSGVELIMDAYYAGSKIRDANGKNRSMTAAELDQFHNKGTGAAWLASAWIAMQYAGVKRAYFYRGNDDNSVPGAGPSSSNVGGPGLFYADGAGTFKPTANAFRFFSRLYRGFPVLLSSAGVPSSSGSTELWALGAQTPMGKTKLCCWPT